jgi:hypothetical protein
MSREQSCRRIWCLFSTRVIPVADADIRGTGLEIPADLLTRDPNDWDYILYEMPDLYYITIIATSISHSELVAHVRRLYSRHHGRTLFGRLRFAMGRFGICDGQPNYEVVLQCWGPQSLWLKESVKRYLDMEYFLKYLGQE